MNLFHEQRPLSSGDTHGFQIAGIIAPYQIHDGLKARILCLFTDCLPYAREQHGQCGQCALIRLRLLARPPPELRHAPIDSALHLTGHLPPRRVLKHFTSHRSSDACDAAPII